MKILMLGWELPPHNSGGLGVACYQLCKSLAQNGADIEFILPYDTKHDIDFMKVTPAHPGIAEAIIPSSVAYDSYRYIYEDGSEEFFDVFAQQNAYENAVERLVEAREFDVIHAHDWLTFRAAIRAKQKVNKPLILHVHSIEKDRAGGHYGNPLVREIEYLSMMIADRVVTVSQHTKDMVEQEYGIPSDKIEVVHNSIDLSEIENSLDENAYKYLEKMKNHGYRVAANVGRLTIQKGLPHLLRAARLVIDKHPKTLFLFVGSGEQRDELLELAAELGIADKVFFAGFQRGRNWRDAYRVADLFVMPSVSEPFGLTPLEAIGYGTPVLISKQSGVSEVIQNCLKVDFWDINEMANQITAVVQNPVLGEELLRNSYHEYQKLSWHNTAVKLIDVYKLHGVTTV